MIWHKNDQYFRVSDSNTILEYIEYSFNESVSWETNYTNGSPSTNYSDDLINITKITINKINEDNSTTRQNYIDIRGKYFEANSSS